MKTGSVWPSQKRIKTVSYTHLDVYKRQELPWAHEIDTLEDLAAIEHTTVRLTEDLKNGVYQDHQYLEAFFAMDEKTHPIAKRITEDYLETEFVDLDHEERIANAVFLYHREIFATYLALLRLSLIHI